MSGSNGSKNTIENYLTLKVKFPKDTKHSHTIFFKPHNLQQDLLPANKTLFVAGLPFYITNASIKQIFSPLGKITAVYLNNTPAFPKKTTPKKSKIDPYKSLIFTDTNNYLYSYVVFDDEFIFEILNKLSLDSIDKPIKCITGIVKTGLSKWIDEYKAIRLSPEIFEKRIRKYMFNYDKEKLRESEALKIETNQPDKDGWITVTKKTRKRIAKSQLRPNKLRRLKSRKKQKELLNFYKFQLRDEKKKQLTELQKKFEEDKMKVEDMKAKRKFKPFS